MKEANLNVGVMRVSELVPYARNARVHTAGQIDEIAASIERFGFSDPVGVWENERGEFEIVEGHGRVMAAEQLGLKEVPVICLDHLTDEERRAYAIVHNQATDNSEWDLVMLESELDRLDFDWPELGIDPAEGLGVSIDGFGDGFELPDGDGPEFKTISLHLTGDQYELITGACDGIDRKAAVMGGGNEYGDKVCEIVRQWAGR